MSKVKLFTTAVSHSRNYNDSGHSIQNKTKLIGKYLDIYFVFYYLWELI